MDKKITTRLFAVMDRDFTYEYYRKEILEKGSRYRVGPHGNRLTDKGFILVLGHGANEIVPKEFFHLEEDIITVTTTTKTRRIKF